jgi:hypothetical protein
MYWLFVTKDTGVRNTRFEDAILGVVTSKENAKAMAHAFRLKKIPFDVYFGTADRYDQAQLAYSVNNSGEESNIQASWLSKNEGNLK